MKNQLLLKNTISITIVKVHVAVEAKHFHVSRFYFLAI